VSQHKSNTIVILNALPGESRYTSRKNAERLVERGLAVPHGQAAIVLVSVEQARRLEMERSRSRADDRLVEDRGGVLWWNGCDHRPSAAHRPGENVFLPRPDRAMPYFMVLEAR
jgi:hypothetical protein